MNVFTEPVELYRNSFSLEILGIDISNLYWKMSIYINIIHFSNILSFLTFLAFQYKKKYFEKSMRLGYNFE